MANQRPRFVRIAFWIHLLALASSESGFQRKRERGRDRCSSNRDGRSPQEDSQLADQSEFTTVSFYGSQPLSAIEASISGKASWSTLSPQDLLRYNEASELFHKTVRELSGQVNTLGGTGGGFQVEVKDIAQDRDTCVAPARLCDARMRELLADMLKDSHHKVTSECSGNRIYYKELHTWACEIDESDYYPALYDSAEKLYLEGATMREAFAPFYHFESLTANLRLCYPEHNSKESTLLALPDSYRVLYDVYFTKLISRIVGGHRYNEFDEMSFVERMATRKAKRERAHVDPTSKLSSSLPYRGSSRSATFPGYLGSVRTESLNVTQEDCDYQSEKGTFKLRFSKHATHDLQHCCSAACEALATFVRAGMGTSSMDTCCGECNKHKCESNSKSQTTTMSEASAITSPSKKEQKWSLIIYTFTV